MTKKSFKSSFDDVLLGEGVPRGNTGIKKGQKQQYAETKSTFVIRHDHLDKVKAIAFVERKMIKDILATALEDYITNYEKINGAVQLPKA
jgi:hypothetical protein